MPIASSLTPESRFMALDIRHLLKTAIIDKDVYERCKNCSWSYCKTRSGNGRIITKIDGQKIPLANFVMDKYDCTYDHKDRNVFNNIKENLREVTFSQNMMNRDKFKNTKCKYKGVRFRKNCPYNPYRAVITVNGKTVQLGSWPTEVEAAKAYDKAAKKYHGEFASLNFKGAL